MNDSLIRNKGFTLLELLVVLVIIGLMVSLVTPRLGASLGKINSLNAIRKIAASLRFARNLAASEKRVYEINFNFQRRQITMLKAPSEFYSDEKKGLFPKGRSLISEKTVSLPAILQIERGESVEGTVSSEEFSFFFFPNGASSGGRLFFKDELGKQYHLEVDFISGTSRLSTS